MSVGYVAVQWNRQKRVYDAVLLGFVIAYLATFVTVGKLAYRGDHAVSDEILAMRALGTCAFLMLNIILAIGPLARIDRRFLPLLYNRRHFGVAMFLVALLHATIAVGFYHGFGSLNPFVSLLAINTGFGSLRSFPYQLTGLFALLILFLMAATSHDFWLKNLTPRVWKRIHMFVYLAYSLVVLHVATGALQSQRNPWLAAMLMLSVAGVSILHLFAGRRENARDSKYAGQSTDGWLDAGPVDEIPLNRAVAVSGRRGERIAVFRHDQGVSATIGVCAHQGGPLAEGKIVDGCITCPWHGWQYQTANGQSPPPFQERIATYRVRLIDGHAWVDPEPLSPGTAVEPARIVGTHA